MLVGCRCEARNLPGFPTVDRPVCIVDNTRFGQRPVSSQDDRADRGRELNRQNARARPPCTNLPHHAVPCRAVPCLAVPCRAVPCRAV
eukprot:102824-Prymnesium_polylepis.1